jgi:hypothetical protein
MLKYGLAVGVLLGCSLQAQAQVSCQRIGNQLFCDNGFSSQRLGQFDFNNDGSMGQRLGPNMYIYTPPPQPPQTWQPQPNPYRQKRPGEF